MLPVNNKIVKSAARYPLATIAPTPEKETAPIAMLITSEGLISPVETIPITLYAIPTPDSTFPAILIGAFFAIL